MKAKQLLDVIVLSNSTSRLINAWKYLSSRFWSIFISFSWFNN